MIAPPVLPHPPSPASAVAAPPAPVPRGPLARCARLLLSPWARLGLLLVLLAAAACVVLMFEPQRLVSEG
ncbi:hypothetical protein HW445_32105, partial [Streptomyces sp. UH6]|nr:hypothetical protein [Streptomyces sp. UH6]